MLGSDGSRRTASVKCLSAASRSGGSCAIATAPNPASPYALLCIDAKPRNSTEASCSRPCTKRLEARLAIAPASTLVNATDIGSPTILKNLLHVLDGGLLHVRKRLHQH